MTRPRPLLAYSDASELETRIVELGGKPFHARIVREQVFTRGVLDYAAMTSLPTALRARLTDEIPITSGREVARTTSADGTTKLLIELSREDDDGDRGAALTVETVHMPSFDRDDRRSGSGARTKGATLCVSTQVGCPVGCPFCASGKLGLVRNLKTHEILEQFVRGQALGPVGRSVVMGIGEPLLNWTALAAALKVVHDDIGLGARKVTVSTVGFPERLRRVARESPRFQLALSLHAPDDEQRAELVPAMKDVPVADLLAAGDDWFEVTGREVTYEVCLLGGVNDSQGHAERLAERLAGRRCTVNLIPFNPVSDSPYRRPSERAIEGYRSTLECARVVATVRRSRGVEADAACGQLRIRRAGEERGAS